MSEKFKYAPGKPGFGTKGDRGVDGQQGLSMYFTDLDPVSNSAIINSRIEYNRDLWDSEGISLPDGRVYVTGDLFFDTEGKAYEINAETNTFEYKYASINIGGFFLPLGLDTSTGFQRYFNSNTSPKYIIDNVYTQSGAINYTAVPENIYNIQPKYFTRIEYTNIKPAAGIYNAFTVYSSGEIVPTDNNKALAIVYDEANNAFRIGNLNDTGNIRNTNLIFDVSNLRQTKELGKNTFNNSTPTGTILTNYEINANMLFDSNFVSNPDSFVGLFPATDCSILWNLSDFFDDGTPPDSGDLYFYQNLSYIGKSYSFTAPDVSLRPMIFTNVPPTGSVRITNLQATGAYDYYMKLYKNGWCRKSMTKTLFKGFISVGPLFLLYEPSIAHAIRGFDVSANGVWDVSINPYGTWITGLSCPSGGDFSNPYDGSILFNMSENTGTQRNATMKTTVFGGASSFSYIMQVGAITNVTISISPISTTYTPITCGGSWDSSHNITLVGLPSDTLVNIQFVESVYCVNSNGTNSVDYSATMQFKKNLSSYSLNLNGSVAPSSTEDVSIGTVITNIGSSDTITTRVPAFGLFAQESLDVPCESVWYLTAQFRVYVTYVSGSPINVLNNGANWSFDIP